MMKIDHGKRLYEAELKRQPNYTASGKPRTPWEQLPETAKERWRERANEGE